MKVVDNGKRKGILLITGDLFEITNEDFNRLEISMVRMGGVIEGAQTLDSDGDQGNVVVKQSIALLICDYEQYLRDLRYSQETPPDAESIESAPENTVTPGPVKFDAENYGTIEIDPAAIVTEGEEESTQDAIKRIMGKNIAHVTRPMLLEKHGVEDEGQTKDDLCELVIIADME